MDKTTLTIDRETSEQITLLAAVDKITKAAVIRRAIAAYAVMRDLNAAAFKPQIEVRA